MLKVLSIFESQIKLLVDTGKPSLHRFLDSLESEICLPASDILALRAKFDLGSGSHFRQEETLNIRSNVFIEKFRRSAKGDSIVVSNFAELCSDSLERLRPSQWLDMWIIAAAMELTDKIACVRCGLSVPLDECRDGKIIPITNPFGLWRKKNQEVQRRSRKGHEIDVFLSPELRHKPFYSTRGQRTTRDNLSL